MKLFYKIHRGGYGSLLAVCDKNIIGKRLKDKKNKLDFFVDPHFYKEDSGNEDTIKRLLAHSVDANLIGKEAVQCGIDLGLIKEENTVKIESIPHAIFSAMKD